LIAGVRDEIARSEYVRFAARLIGVEPSVVEKAMGTGPRNRLQGDRTGPDQTASRFEAELMRVILANPAEMVEVDLQSEWFASPDLAAAVAELTERRKRVSPGEPLDITGLAAMDLLSPLALDPRPLPKDPLELIRRAEVKAVEAEIDLLEKELIQADPSSQSYSDLLRRLIALQAERRKQEP
jgi:hypothetical protein